MAVVERLGAAGGASGNRMIEMDIAASDEVILSGSLHLPTDPRPSACVVALHAASAGTRDHSLYAHLRDLLVPAGVGVALFDRRGTGSSGGDPRASLYRLADDARAVVRHVASHDRVDRDHVGVWGISQGGWLAAMVAADGDAVAFVITVSASGVSPSSQMHYAMENALRERAFGDHDVAEAHAARSAIDEAHLAGDIDGARAARVRVADAAWVRHAYLPDLDDLTEEPSGIDLDPPAIFAKIDVPTLAIYGEWDRWVPIEASIAAWEAAFDERPHLLAIERIAGAGHMMTTPWDPRDPDEAGPIAGAYGSVLRGWVASRAARARHDGQRNGSTTRLDDPSSDRDPRR